MFHVSMSTFISISTTSVNHLCMAKDTTKYSPRNGSYGNTYLCDKNDSKKHNITM